jgi:hypothetical protein
MADEGVARSLAPLLQLPSFTQGAKTMRNFKTAIYAPPARGMPFLVVTLGENGLSVLATPSRKEARVEAARISGNTEKRIEAAPGTVAVPYASLMKL